MIHFKDFFPEITKTRLLGAALESEPFDLVVKSANSWINSNAVKLLNLETVILPHELRKQRVNSLQGLYGTNASGLAWVQGVRVWYEET